MNYQGIDFEAAYGTFSQLPASTVPEIAFIGRSNVGKSSLINRLCSRKSLARTSGVPGKTITVNFYSTKEKSFRFADLPGYGYAKVAKSEKARWAEMMEGYFSSGRSIRLALELMDMRHAPTEDDMMMLDFLSESGFGTVVILTKADKLKKTEYLSQKQFYEDEIAKPYGIEVIPFSAITGEGADKIKALIERAL